MEWSTSDSFKRILGSIQVTETKNPSYTIKGLTTVSHARPLLYTTSMQSTWHEYARAAHRFDSIYTLSSSVLPTGQQLSLTMYELMMKATCISSGLLMHGDNLPVCCLSKCRGYIILWEWVASMWKDGDRLSAQLLPVLPPPVSRVFLTLNPEQLLLQRHKISKCRNSESKMQLLLSHNPQAS